MALYIPRQRLVQQLLPFFISMSRVESRTTLLAFLLNLPHIVILSVRESADNDLHNEVRPA